MAMRSVGLTVLGLLLLSWGGYSVYGVYDMAVVRDVYTPQLTISVSVMALSSLLSGLGALNRKAWSLKAYVVFAGVVLALMVYTKDFGMESSDKEFMIAFLAASVILFLAGLYLKRQLIEKL